MKLKPNTNEKTDRRESSGKKLATVLLSLLLLLSLALTLGGCGKETADPLAYQSYPLTVEGSITGDKGEAEVTLEMTAPMTGKLSFHTPDSLRGYLFSVGKDGVTLSYGEITVPYKADGIPGGTHLLPRLFSLSGEKLVSAEETEMNSLPLLLATFETEEGETVKVYIDKQSGTPLRFEVRQGDGQLVFTVKDFQKADVGSELPSGS